MKVCLGAGSKDWSRYSSKTGPAYPCDPSLRMSIPEPWPRRLAQSSTSCCSWLSRTIRNGFKRDMCVLMRHGWVNRHGTPECERAAPNAPLAADRCLAFGRRLQSGCFDRRQGGSWRWRRRYFAVCAGDAEGDVADCDVSARECPIPVCRMNVSLRPGPSTMSITAPEGSVQSTFAGREILACARVREEEEVGIGTRPPASTRPS